MLSFLGKPISFRKFQSFKYIDMRCVTTEIGMVEKFDSIILKQKRFTKPCTNIKKLQANGSYVKKLFRAEFDREILKYPSHLNGDELSNLNKHGNEVKSFLGNVFRSNLKLTPELFKDLENFELLGLTIPQKYGGLGYTTTEAKFILECIGAQSSIARYICHNEDFGVKILTLWGSEDQRNKYLPKIASGEGLMSLAFLESGPLIDLTSIASVAVKNSDNLGFVLNGKKKWVINADLSDWFIVLTKLLTEKEHILKSDLRLLIVNKNSPGVTFHKVESQSANDFELFDVNFENVIVEENKLIQADNTLDILRTCLASSCLSCAVLCSNFLKSVTQAILKFCESKFFNEQPYSQSCYIQNEMAFISAYGFALESLIYFVCGRFDLYEESDLFLDAVVVKLFAVNSLNIVIQKYFQILGQHSYIKSEIVEEALKVLQYYSVFEENDSHLKLMVGCSGFLEASSPLRNMILKVKKPFENPVEAFNWLFPSENKKYSDKLLFNLKKDFRPEFRNTAHFLESSVAKFQVAVEEHIFRNGNLALERETTVTRFTEMITYIYAMTACLARILNNIEQTKTYEREINISSLFGGMAHVEVEHLYNQTVKFRDAVMLYKDIGELSFANKKYPAEHPLIRTY